MKRNGPIFLFASCFIAIASGILSCDTAGNLEDPDLHYFVKYYGADGNQIGVDMLALNDGSFLLLGNSEQNFDSDIYLVKVNSEGDIIWEKRFKHSAITRAKDMEPTPDGNFIILADYQTGIGTQMNGKLIKVSTDGVMLDSVEFGTSANDLSKSVTVLTDGGFIVSGTTELTSTFADVNNPDPDLGNFFNYRFDQNLDEVPSNVWSPVFPGFGGKLDVAVKAIQKPGEYYIIGYSNTNQSNNNPNKRLGLTYFRRDVFGGENLILYPGKPVDVGEDTDTEIHFVENVPPQLGDGLIVIGTSRNNIGVSDIFIARLRSVLMFEDKDNDATIYNIMPMGRNIQGVAATSSLTGSVGFIVLGNEVRSTGATNIWVTKIDQSRRVIWSSTFGSEEGNDSGAAVKELPDGKILVLGTMGLADNQFKMALIKINPSGELLK